MDTGAEMADTPPTVRRLQLPASWSTTPPALPAAPPPRGGASSALDAAGQQDHAGMSLGQVQVRIVNYDVLGMQLVPDSGIARQAAEPPNELTAFVDSVGLEVIRRCGPASASGASGSIYEHIGIRGDDAFPDEVRGAIEEECDAGYHMFATPDPNPSRSTLPPTLTQSPDHNPLP